jgi:hypothetical protein
MRQPSAHELLPFIETCVVPHSFFFHKQVAKEAEETLARQTLQIGDINSQILRLGMDNATKADISNVRSEVANMKGHFSELREHVMDAGLGKADEEEVRAGFIKLQVAMEERAGQETSINSKVRVYPVLCSINQPLRSLAFSSPARLARWWSLKGTRREELPSW